MIKTIFRLLLGILILALIAGAVGSVDYFSHFNRLVQEKFSGRLWALPARVYARPLELYAGLALEADNLAQELRLMRYQAVAGQVALNRPGTYLRTGNAVTIFCRPFNFGDRPRPAQQITIRLKNGHIESVVDVATGQRHDLIRLDPMRIGSFYPVNNEDRIIVALDDAPALLSQSIISVEDRHFYRHHGIEPMGVLRAMLVNLKQRRLAQGASTITQQLARNFFLTNQKTWKRKIDELVMALAMEHNYTKDQILEAYVNEVYLGQDGNRAIHGFGLASVFYFGKALDDLTVDEMALLVGLLKGPSYYNPRKYPQRALQRRNTVLTILRDRNLIDIDAANLALARPLGVTETPPSDASPFPAYLDLVKRQLLQEYRETDLRSIGLRIFTALDPQIQQVAQQAVASQIARLEASAGLPADKLQAGVVITSTAENEVLAAIGGKHAGQGGFNRALDAIRPIGSLIKPVVFLTALNRPDRYTLTTLVADTPIRVRTDTGDYWSPRNFDRIFHGNVPLYQALAHSYNVATVSIGMDLGLPRVLATLQDMGYAKPIRMYPAALLGAIEMSCLEVTQIYQTLASGGFYSSPKSIRAVYDLENNLLQRYPLTIEQHLDPGAVFLVNKALQAAVASGTARQLTSMVSSGLAIAGKTGTSTDLKDSWFAGFSGNRLAAVWVGRDDNRSCGLTGAAGAMQIWGRIMTHIPNQPLRLNPPDNIEWVVIDHESGLRTEHTCPTAIAAPFIRGSAPTRFSSCGATKSSEPKAPATPAEKKYLIDWFREWLK